MIRDDLLRSYARFDRAKDIQLHQIVKVDPFVLRGGLFRLSVEAVILRQSLPSLGNRCEEPLISAHGMPPFTYPLFALCQSWVGVSACVMS